MPRFQWSQVGSLLIRASVCGALAILIALRSVSSASAAQVDLAKPIEFHIPAQPLAPALLQFSSQARVQIASFGKEVGGIQSPGVSGVWPIGAALEQLLSGTGFGYRISGKDSIVVALQIVGAAAIDPIPRTSSEQKIAPPLTQASGAPKGEDNPDSQAGPGSAPKTDRSPGALQEIIVTARKREENAQDVPLSLTVLDAAALAKIGFINITDLRDRVPALDVTPDNNSPSEMVIFIRGIGGTDDEQLTRDNGVGVYLDDVYVGHGMMLASELADTERIEILPGPQGTLYGRNTVGGAVKFISAKPTGEFDIKESLDAGNFGYVHEVANVDMPKVAQVSVKLSALYSHSDGWVTNTGAAGDFGRKDATGFRGAMRWQPADELTFDYVYDYGHSHGTPNYLQYQYNLNLYGYNIQPVSPNRQEQSWRPENLPEDDRFTGSGHAVTAVWNISQQLSLKSITAYRKFDSGYFADSTEGFDLAFVQAITTTQHQFSQELLLTGNTADSAVSYHLGLFYFRESGLQYFSQTNDFAALSAAVPYVPPTLADMNLNCVCAARNSSKAVYGQVTWTLPILDHRLSIDVGGRESSDTRGVTRHRPFSVAPLPVDDSAEASYSSFDPAITIDYKVTQTAHIYAKVAKAYQAGGFDAFNNDFAHPFGPEHVTNYEVGWKSELLQRRLLLNVDAFKEKYRNIQEIFFDPNYSANGGAQLTVNAGSAQIKGGEAQIELLPVEALHLSAQIVYLDTKGTVTDPFFFITTTGPLSNSPKWKTDLSAEYTLARFRFGQLSGIVEYGYNAKQLPIGETGIVDYRPAYWLLDARVSLSDIDVRNGKLVVSAWGKNLRDAQYETYHAFQGVQFGQPRSYGVNVTYKYR